MVCVSEVIAPDDCKTARYVGGTSIYLCECTPPCKPMEITKVEFDAFWQHRTEMMKWSLIETMQRTGLSKRKILYINANSSALWHLFRVEKGITSAAPHA